MEPAWISMSMLLCFCREKLKFLDDVDDCVNIFWPWPWQPKASSASDLQHHSLYIYTYRRVRSGSSCNSSTRCQTVVFWAKIYIKIALHLTSTLLNEAHKVVFLWISQSIFPKTSFVAILADLYVRPSICSSDRQIHGFTLEGPRILLCDGCIHLQNAWLNLWYKL